ncbi:Protein NRT1/ PTR FAMILY 1.2 [Linum perenne]
MMIPDKRNPDKKAPGITEPILSTHYSNKNQKGGFRTLPFIIGTEAFEKVATLGLMPNMILYLTREYGMGNIQGANIIFIWSAASNFTPVLGAFLADAYVGRFWMITFGSIFSLLGLVVLWLTAMIPQARPPPCSDPGQFSNSTTTNIYCDKTATTPQLFLLYSSFVLMSIGSGGVRSSSMAFGADQLTPLRKGKSKAGGILESFFSWYYMLVSVSIILALTCIVYIQETMGWKVGFGVPMALMMFSSLSFFLASPFYINCKTNSSFLTGLAQVLVASFKNRGFDLPKDGMADVEAFHNPNRLNPLLPSDHLRFLNKACKIKNPIEDLTAEGRASNPWRLCTVDQVEDLKSLIRIIPIWSTGMIMAIDINQGSFQTIMAANMDRHLLPKLQIPAGSFSVFMLAALSLSIIIYNKVLIPIGSKIRGKPTRLTTKQRMGIGILISSISMAALAAVEALRRRIAIQGLKRLSAMWMMPHLILLGMAEGLNGSAQNEFYYTELPENMRSISTTLWGLAMSGASLASSFIMSTVDKLTSWTRSNVNEGHYDYYYWVLASLSLANFMYYLACSKAYGPCLEKGKQDKVVEDEDEDDFTDGDLA